MKMFVFTVKVARIFIAVIIKCVCVVVFPLEKTRRTRSTEEVNPATAPTRRNQYPACLFQLRYKLMKLPDWYRLAVTKANVLYAAIRMPPIQEVNGQVEYTGEICGKAPVFGSRGRET